MGERGMGESDEEGGGAGVRPGKGYRTRLVLGRVEESDAGRVSGRAAERGLGGLGGRCLSRAACVVGAESRQS